MTTLEAWTTKQQATTNQFNEEQELFLSPDPRYLAFIYELYDRSLEEIQQHYGLTPQSMDRYLLRLEQHELVTVSPSGKVRPEDSSKDCKVHLMFDYEGLSENTLESLQKEWTVLCEKIRADLQDGTEAKAPGSLLFDHFRVCKAADARDPDAVALNQVFGKITNFLAESRSRMAILRCAPLSRELLKAERPDKPSSSRRG